MGAMPWPRLSRRKLLLHTQNTTIALSACHSAAVQLFKHRNDHPAAAANRLPDFADSGGTSLGKKSRDYLCCTHKVLREQHHFSTKLNRFAALEKKTEGLLCR